MELGEAIALVAGLVTSGMALLIWWERRGAARAQADRDEQVRAFAERQARPDLAGLEQHLGGPLPQAFMTLHRDPDLAASENLLLDLPAPSGEEPGLFVAWFEPADSQSLEDVWPGCEGLFPLADDGTGNQYLVDLGQADPEVVLLYHEADERTALGCRLSQFVDAARHASGSR